LHHRHHLCHPFSLRQEDVEGADDDEEDEAASGVAQMLGGLALPQGVTVVGTHPAFGPIVSLGGQLMPLAMLQQGLDDNEAERDSDDDSGSDSDDDHGDDDHDDDDGEEEEEDEDEEGEEDDEE